MRRGWLAALACAAFSGLSCSVFAPGAGELPPVSAATAARPEAPVVRE
jgi:hypothetical protein